MEAERGFWKLLRQWRLFFSFELGVFGIAGRLPVFGATSEKSILILDKVDVLSLPSLQPIYRPAEKSP